MPSLPRPAIFLDRDGTLIEDQHYLKTPDQVVFIKGCEAALRSLAINGWDLFLVTNQSGVGRGYFTMDDVTAVHDHIERHLALKEVRFRAIYVAPEAPGQPSYGRKPEPGFLLQAAKEFGTPLSHSYMIGDKEADVLCGLRAGVRQSVLVRTGKGLETEKAMLAKGTPCLIVNSVVDAAITILNAQQS